MTMNGEISEDGGDTSEGSMWIFDQKLDQPMDEEPRRLRTMYREKKIYKCLINGVLKSTKISKLTNLLAEMHNHGLSPNIVTNGALITGWCDQGMLDKAFYVYFEMIKKDSSRYSRFMGHDDICSSGVVVFDMLEVDDARYVVHFMLANKQVKC
ncbi:hypothetical protein ACFE04_002471 [Oxalis oulophora]